MHTRRELAGAASQGRPRQAGRSVRRSMARLAHRHVRSLNPICCMTYALVHHSCVCMPCRGSDKGLSSVSTLFTSLYTLLQRKHSRTEADRLVRAALSLQLKPKTQRYGVASTSSHRRLCSCCSTFVRAQSVAASDILAVPQASTGFDCIGGLRASDPPAPPGPL